MAEAQVEKTIKLYESLVTDLPCAESWAYNILEASKKLTTGIAQTNFYRYLFDPTNYVFQEDIKTISKADEDKYNEMVAEFDKNNSLQVTYYKNGSDMNIVYLIKQTMPKKANPWLVFLKQFRAKHKTMSMKLAMKAAAKQYKKKKKMINGKTT